MAGEAASSSKHELKDESQEHFPDRSQNARLMNSQRKEQQVAGDEEEVEEATGDPEPWEHPERLFKKFAEQPLNVRVHDVKINGNSRTKDSVIEAEFENVKKVRTSKELLKQVSLANARLESLGIFEECVITLEPGPIELPGTANVIVDVKELSRPYSGAFGVYSRPETRSWTFEGSLKLKNLLGHAETWDGTGSCGWDGMTELSAGLHYPKFKKLPAALVTRASVFNQDWMNFSSYTEKLVSLSAGLVAADNHDLSYNLTWRTLQDPEGNASRSIRRQLGHSLLSALKYTYKIDRRDSPLRPTKGYAFKSVTQVAGLGPDSKLLRFVRQELDLRCAVPLGLFNSTLNLGISGGLIIPWGAGFREKTTPISNRFFIGGHTSLVCGLHGPVTVPGFPTRGLGPMELKRASTLVQDSSDPDKKRDSLGGDLAFTSFADLSFDFPFNFLREQEIHGHCFVSAGNLFGLPELDRRSLTLANLWASTRVSAGAGIVIPTKLFRFELNFCHVFRQFDDDRGKRGFQFSFASPY